MVESSSLPSHMWLVLLRLSITLLIDFTALFDDLSLTRDKKFENKKSCQITTYFDTLSCQQKC